MAPNSHQADMEDVAERAAEKAIEKFFVRLGVDTADPIAMQKDFAHLRAWRESLELVRRRGILTAAAIVTTGLLGMIYTTFKH